MHRLDLPVLGAIVSKAEYDKAYQKAKTGEFKLY